MSDHHEKFENTVKRLEDEARRGDTDALARELHSMSEEERHAIAERIKRDAKHASAHLPKLEFSADSDLERAVYKENDETRHDVQYDDGHKRSEHITEPGWFQRDINYEPGGDKDIIKSDHIKYDNGNYTYTDYSHGVRRFNHDEMMIKGGKAKVDTAYDNIGRPVHQTSKTPQDKGHTNEVWYKPNVDNVIWSEVRRDNKTLKEEVIVDKGVLVDQSPPKTGKQK